MSLYVIILAAGLGKRMRSTLPKVLHGLAGRPLLQHVIDTAHQLEPKQIWVVHGHTPLQPHLPQANVHWVHQTQALGTGHAVQQAVAAMPLQAKDQVLVLYGDVPLIQASTLHALQATVKAGAQLAVLTARVTQPKGFGRIVRDPHGALVAIVEEVDASDSERQIDEINSGLMIFQADVLQALLPQLHCDNAQGEYYLTDVIHLAKQQGLSLATYTCPDSSEIQGINDRSQLAQAERYYQRRVAEALLHHGVSLADPARIDVRGSLTVESDSFIDVNCVFEGEVRVGARVRIGAHCCVKDAVIGDDVILHPHSLIEGAHVHARASIGPFARLRPGTCIAEEAHIGNFVELKNTQFGVGSKASHLAYLGDALIGSHVNIGAGVITCNYDGVNKHTTRIEDEAFIGADSQLVAPVVIGQGATIGSGSTITKEVPAHQLTLSRAKQVTVAGWQRPSKKNKAKK